MDIYKATEQAYKNGYAAGAKAFAEILKSKSVFFPYDVYIDNELKKLAEQNKNVEGAKK